MTMRSALPGGPNSEGVGSLEVRWIFPGEPAAGMVGWFGRFPAEVRLVEELYLLDPHLPGLSVKLRGQRSLEVKAYRGGAGGGGAGVRPAGAVAQVVVSAWPTRRRE